MVMNHLPSPSVLVKVPVAEEVLSEIVSLPISDASEEEISIFALSTYDTDYLLVPVERLQRAVTALEAAGHRLRA